MKCDVVTLGRIGLATAAVLTASSIGLYLKGDPNHGYACGVLALVPVALTAGAICTHLKGSSPRSKLP
jgi:hypothetical protein